MGEFPTQRASYAENVSIWWRHHATQLNLKSLWSEPPETPCLNEIMARISNYIDYFVWDEITNPYHNINSGLTKPPLQFVYGGVIIFYWFTWIQLLFHVLILSVYVCKRGLMEAWSQFRSKIVKLKTQSCRDANFFAACATVDCHRVSLRCHQKRQGWHHYIYGDVSFISIDTI